MSLFHVIFIAVAIGLRLVFYAVEALRPAPNASEALA